MTSQGARQPPHRVLGHHPPGIAPCRNGWRVYVRIRGIYRSKLFPAEKTTAELEEEREAMRVDLRRELAKPDGREPAPSDDKPFAAAAARYLEAVTAMPTYRERARDIALWVAEFGDRPRDSMTSAEIRTICDRWLAVGPRMIRKPSKAPKAKGKRPGTTSAAVKGPLSASTVNHRKRALENLFTVLGGGPHAPNPAREVPEYDEPDEAPAPWRLAHSSVPPIGECERLNRPSGWPPGLTAACQALAAARGRVGSGAQHLNPDCIPAEARNEIDYACPTLLWADGGTQAPDRPRASVPRTQAVAGVRAI